MRRLCLTFFALLVVLTGGQSASAQALPREPAATRFASYNIQWFSEDSNPGRLLNLKTIIERLDAQVICLQEIQSKKALEQIFNQDWQIAIADLPTEDQETAVVVKKPLKLIESGLIFTTKDLDYAFPGGRDVMRAVVETPSGEKFTVYSIHAKSRRGGRIPTDLQRQMAAGMLSSYIKWKGEPNVVVAGDFNDSPYDLSLNILETGILNSTPGALPADATPNLINLFESIYSNDGVSIGLQDKYEGTDMIPRVNGAAAENEKFRGKVYRYPQDLAVTQTLFDQILVSTELKKKFANKVGIYSRAEALRGTLGRVRRDNATGVTTYLEKGSLASDHLPVFADFNL